MTHDEAAARARRGVALPPWLLDGNGRYQQLNEAALRAAAESAAVRA
jgi:hypothetical protein